MHRCPAARILFLRRKKHRIQRKMFLTQVENFVNSYYNVMENREQVEVDEQKEIQTVLTDLAELIDEKKAAIAAADEDYANVSPISSASSGSRVSDLGFDELNIGPQVLRGPKKLEFMMIVKRDLLEFLSSPLLENTARRHHAELICKNSNIPRNVYLEWTV